MPSHTPLHIGIFLFDDVEALDFAGPYEVFTTATRVACRRHATAPGLFTVSAIAANGQPVRARAGLQIMPDHTFGTHPAVDVLIVPGGVVTAEMHKPEVIEWVAQTASQAQITASVCTGAFLLAQAGVLTQGPVTTHLEDLSDLQALFPNLQVVSDRRWVDTGRVLSSAGISAGIDMCLHLVDRLHSRELAQGTARQMDYAWQTQV
jgi:transcriptional regulator GlxA family with amidase domain